MLNWRFQQPASAIQIPASIARDIELAQSANFSIGNVQVQPATLQVIDGTCSSTLERRVMQVLVALASRRGAVASRAYLVDACWGGRAISEDAINRCILKLRRLGAATDSFEIQTIPTVGYRLIERETVSSDRQRERLTQWQWVGAALVSLAAISGLLWHFATTGVPGSPSIAVGTFTALNSDPDAKLYAASITSAVSDALVGTGARLASAEEPITTVDRARRADAALLVAGTIRNQNNTIKVTVTVQSVRTGVTLVSTDFQSPASEASSLADHLAATVSSRLNPWVTVAKTERDPVVCEQILRSWSLLFSNPLKAWSVTKDLAAAKPNSAAAQEAFAATTAYWLDDIPRDQRDAMVAAAREAAARAATLNPAKAFLLSCLLRPPGLLIMTARCDAAVRRSLAIDSSSPFESAYFAEMLANSGRLREALSVSETSLADSPYDAGRISLRMFIIQMEYSGDHQNELPGLRVRAQRYAPETLKDILRYEEDLAKGDMAAAEAVLNDPVTGDQIDSGPGKDIDNTIIRAVITRKPADLASAKGKCLPPPPMWPVGTGFLTCIVGLTMLGDLDSAFSLAERGYADVEHGSPAERERRWLETGGLYYPRFELWGTATRPLRADLRFILIARNVGLLSYWKSGHPPDFCGFERAPVCQLLKSS